MVGGSAERSPQECSPVLYVKFRGSKDIGQKASTFMCEENKDIVRRYLEGLSKGDLGIVDRLISGDFVPHNPAVVGSPPGRHGQKQIISSLRSGIPRPYICDSRHYRGGGQSRSTLEGLWDSQGRVDGETSYRQRDNPFNHYLLPDLRWEDS